MIQPAERLTHTAEANFVRHSLRTRVIYLGVLGLTFGALLVLPLIHVEVGVRSHGMMRPGVERIPVHVPVDGIVETLTISENARVDSGAVMITLNTELVEESLRVAADQSERTAQSLRDLMLLTGSEPDAGTAMEIQSTRYRQDLREFQLQIMRAEQELQRSERALDRNRTLYNRQLISLVELEESQYERDQAAQALHLIRESQIQRWLLEQRDLQELQERLQVEIHTLKRSLENHRILAPVRGTVQNLAGLQRGSHLFANQLIAEISPDTSLIAELYVNPEDVGLLRRGMPVRAQIDAYDHNYWGIVDGVVEEIPDDVTYISESQPVFRVRCSLNRQFLELDSGHRGELMKGMTLQARLIVARRSLYQLLFDKIDDWLNPLWE